MVLSRAETSIAGTHWAAASWLYAALMQRRPSAREPLSWDDVRLFLALCRSSTVGAAGKLLGVDGSTVSRRLAVLEDALGVSLFDRGREGIAPTKAAEDLQPVAEEMESVMLRFSTAADGLEREVEGTVRMTCPPDVAEILVAPILPSLVARHPRLRLVLDPAEAVLDLSRREADIALRTVRPSRGDLIVVKLLSVTWVVCAAPSLAKKVGALRAWSDVPWVGWGERLAQAPPARWIAANVDEHAQIVRTDSMRLLLAVAAQGIGAVLVPAPSVAPFGLVPLKLAKPLRDEAARLPNDDLFLVTHRALRDVPRVRAVWEAIVARAAEWKPA